MLTIGNDGLSLEMKEDGSGLLLTDRLRGCRWHLSPAHQGYRMEGARDRFLRWPPGAGKAQRTGDAIVVSYPLGGGAARFTWTLARDHVQVELDCDAAGVEFIALPGVFFPAGGEHAESSKPLGEVAIPVYQGLLIRSGGSDWEMVRGHAGHSNFSMAMGAVLQPAGALLATHECPVNWHVAFGQCDEGAFFRFEQWRCPVDGWAGAAVRFYPVDAGVAAVCKRYRQRVKERGELVTWAQKIEAKPIVKDLFGALMAFVGYNRSAGTDYAACARKLREYGFENVFYYPLRMCQYSLGFKMGGDDPIWLDDATMAAVKAVPGAHPGPWGWCIEGLDDGSKAMRDIYLLDCQGKPHPNWKIDQFQWYLVCTPYQIEHMKRRFATDMKAMDWVHYDVSANTGGFNCFAPRHALHGGKPLGRIEDTQWVRRLFAPQTVGNRVVSSEGFGDHFAAWYDVGSTKIMPSLGERPLATPVPMTMLVFHDSCIHDWWEVHNYNAHVGFPISEVENGLGSVGCGSPRLKAAQDALAGSPPNLFPFGRQYAWSNFEKKESYSYEVRLEDEPVREALAAALPVAKLHKRIGMCELTGFEMLSEDRLVQATTFSDGTRIVANLSRRDQEAAGLGLLPAWSWRQA